MILSTAVVVYLIVEFMEKLDDNDEQLMQFVAHQDSRIDDLLTRANQDRRELEDRLVAFVDAAHQWSTLPTVKAVQPNVPDAELVYADSEVEGRFSGASQT
jgi:hypothetical protein